MLDTVVQDITKYAELGVTLLLGIVGLYFTHNLGRQISLKVAEKRLEAYAELWSLMYIARPSRLPEDEEDEEETNRPLTLMERQILYRQMTAWYYKKGYGMLLPRGTHEMYLRAKENLVCAPKYFKPYKLRRELEALEKQIEDADMAAKEQAEQAYLKRRGKISIRQLSLLRTRMKADLEVYGGAPTRRLQCEDIAFVEACGEATWQKPWRDTP